jgi:hypothetical protein
VVSKWSLRDGGYENSKVIFEIERATSQFSVSRRGKRFPTCLPCPYRLSKVHLSYYAVGGTAFSAVVKRLESKSYRLLPSNAEINNVWSCTSNPPNLHCIVHNWLQSRGTLSACGIFISFGMLSTTREATSCEATR